MVSRSSVTIMAHTPPASIRLIVGCAPASSPKTRVAVRPAFHSRGCTIIMVHHSWDSSFCDDAEGPHH